MTWFLVAKLFLSVYQKKAHFIPIPNLLGFFSGPSNVLGIILSNDLIVHMCMGIPAWLILTETMTCTKYVCYDFSVFPHCPIKERFPINLVMTRTFLFLNKPWLRGTWVVQLVKHLPSAQIMILGSWDRALRLGSVLSGTFAAPSVCCSLCLCSLSLFLSFK